MSIPLTHEQRCLARRALGLPNHHNVSYRNRYVAAERSLQADEWSAMEAAGAAVQDPDAGVMRSGIMFCLTRAGAEAAIEVVCTETAGAGPGQENGWTER